MVTLPVMVMFERVRSSGATGNPGDNGDPGDPGAATGRAGTGAARRARDAVAAVVVLHLAHALAHLFHLGGDAEQVLHMVADLMGINVKVSAENTGNLKKTCF